MAEGAADAVSRASARASRLLVIALFATLLTVMGFVLWNWYRALSFPYPLDYGEGPLLAHAVRLAHGDPVYVVPGAAPPWTVVNYPPVYPLLNAVGSMLAGPAFWYGRLLSMLGAVAAATFAGLIVAQLTRDRVAALVTALLMPAVPYLGYWAALARVDALALAFSLAGLWCVVRQPASNRWLIAAVVLLTAAAYTRQTYLLVAPVAAFCWLWPDGRRRALGFAAALAGIVVILGLALNLATHGGFWFNVVTANVNAYDWELLLAYVHDIAGTIPLLIILLIACVVVAVRHRQESARLLLPYTLGALVVTLTAGKEGSSVNYLLELGTALSLAAGFLLATARHFPRARLAVLGVLLVQTVHLAAFPHGFYGYLNSTIGHRAESARISAVVAESDDPILADEDMGFLPLNGRPITLQPFEFSQLDRAGVWDQAPLLTALEQHRLPLIIIYVNKQDPPVQEQRWTPEMLAAIRANYRVTESIDRAHGQTLIYQPKR